MSGRHAEEVPAAVGKHSTEARKLFCIRRCEARSQPEEGSPAEGRAGGQASSCRGRDDCWGDAEDAGRAQGGGRQDAGGEVELLLLHDCRLKLGHICQCPEAWNFYCASRYLDKNCLDLFFVSVSAEDREKFEKAESRKQQNKGKALFQRRKEREREDEEVEKCNEEEEEERLAPVELLPGVDMDEMRMTVREKYLGSCEDCLLLLR